jgi:DNA-binding transcriptional LysR family regulator
MDTNQLDGLIALRAVADKRSFTAAAETLGISPSAVSQIIKQLERRLGVALLARTTRSTSLTEVGERFLSQSAPAMDQILLAMETVGTYAEKPSGLLRLNLPRSIYPFLAPVMRSFAKKYPEVSIELFFDDDLTDVVGKGFDAGIRLSEMIARDVVAMKLFGPLRFVVAGAPKYLNKVGRPKHPKDLLTHDCIRLRVGESDFYDRWEFESKGKDFEVQISGSLIINDPQFIVEAATSGMGLLYFAEEFIRDKIEAGKLEVVLEQYAAVSDGFYLYYPKRSQVLPKLRAFIDHLKSEKR